MGAKSEQARGRLKKAVGELTHNERLKREGHKDVTAGKARELKEKLRAMKKTITDGQS